MKESCREKWDLDLCRGYDLIDKMRKQFERLGREAFKLSRRFSEFE